MAVPFWWPNTQSVQEVDFPLAGAIQADLWVPTTCLDADWILKVIYVWLEDAKGPEGLPAGVNIWGYE